MKSLQYLRQSVGVQDFTIPVVYAKATEMKSPYSDLPKSAFWKSAVSERGDLHGIYVRKWEIATSDKIATAGSCFAQHIGRHLKRHGFNVMDMEPSPQALSEKDQLIFGYSTYSARYGNIYTTRQLLQLAQEAFGQFVPAEIAWQNGTYAWYDALRPGVEPEGLTSSAEVFVHRREHLDRVREMLELMDLMVFTLGLTETWTHRESGTAYPTAPGTIAGSYDPNVYQFKSLDYNEVVSDFLEFRQLVHSRQVKKCKFLLTVSPVPLTATASHNHVMLATVYSKSVLRAAAGHLATQYDDIDYFPSYEIITNPWSPTLFYEENLRSVKGLGVDLVMQTFFSQHLGAHEKRLNEPAPIIGRAYQDPVYESDVVDVVCEDAILEAFAQKIIS